MSYDKIVEEAFENIIKLSNKLNDYDSKFLMRYVNVIANCVNSFENRISKISSRNNKIKEPEYQDRLEFYMTICVLHGYTDIEIDKIKFERFVSWFSEHALNNSHYKSDLISKQILMAFFDSFVLFEFTYDRLPLDYYELRKFLLTWEDMVDEKIKSEIEKLTV